MIAANDNIPDDLLTADEFQQQFMGKLFSSRAGCYRFMNDPKTPFFKLRGRWLVRRSDLDAYLRKQDAA